MIQRFLIRRDIRAIASSLQAEDRERLRALREDELIQVHHSMGRFLRNAFRSGTYSALFLWCDQQETPETRSFDSISQTAIKLVWQHLRRGDDGQSASAE